jgi:hypothetical protein
LSSHCEARFLPSLNHLDIEGCHHVSEASLRLLRNRPFLKLIYPSILQAELKYGATGFFFFFFWRVGLVGIYGFGFGFASVVFSFFLFFLF